MAEYTLKAKLVADAKDFQGGFRDAQNALDGIKNKTVSTGATFEKTGKKISDAGRDMSAKITAPITGIGVLSLKTGADFEQAMSRVAAVSGATGADFEKLEKQARELGRSTQFSASEAASGMEYLAMAGFDTNEIIGAMPGMLNLAAAGTLDLGDAADIASNIMSGFGIEAKEAGRVADVLAKAATSANTDVGQLGEAMKYLAPTANALGWSLEESSAAVMTLSDAGIQGSMAGQAFASSLTRLTDENGKAAETAKELGIEFFNAQGQMKPLHEVIAELEKGLEGMTDKQKASALSAMFGTEAYKHWQILLDEGSDKLAKHTDMLEKSEGTAAKVAETMNDNLIGKLKELGAVFEDIQISVYNYAKPGLELLVEKVTDGAKAFQKLPESTQAAALGMLGLLAVFPLLLTGFGMFVSFTGSAMAGIGALLSPVGLLVAAFLGIGTALGITSIKSEEFRNKMFETFSTIRQSIPETMEGIKQKLSEVWEGAGEGLSNFITNISNTMNALIGFVAPLGVMIWDFVTSVIDGFSSAGGSAESFLSIFALFNPILHLVITLFTQFGDRIIDSFSGIGELVLPLLSTLGELLGHFAATLLPLISQAMNNLAPILMTIFEVLMGIVKAVLPIILDLIIQLAPVFMEIVTLVADLLTQIMPLVSILMSSLVPVIMIIIEHVLHIVKAIMPALIGVIQAVISVIKVIAPIVTSILTVVINVIANIISAVTPIIAFVAGVISSIISIISPIVAFIAGIITSIMSTIAPIVTFVSGTFSTVFSIISGVFRGVLNIITGVIRTATSIISTLSATVSKVFNKIASIVSRVMSTVSSTITRVFSGIQSAWSGLTGFVGGVFTGIEDAVKTLTNQVKGFVNGVIRGINAAIDIINKIPGVNISPIPQLARGTDNWSGGFARINEGGRGELVLLPSGTQVIPHDVSMRYAREAGKAQGSHAVHNTSTEQENISMDGMFRGANFVVRKDEDIYGISRELYKLIERGRKGRGGGL